MTNTNQIAISVNARAFLTTLVATSDPVENPTRAPMLLTPGGSLWGTDGHRLVNTSPVASESTSALQALGDPLLVQFDRRDKAALLRLKPKSDTPWQLLIDTPADPADGAPQARLLVVNQGRKSERSFHPIPTSNSYAYTQHPCHRLPPVIRDALQALQALPEDLATYNPTFNSRAGTQGGLRPVVQSFDYANMVADLQRAAGAKGLTLVPLASRHSGFDFVERGQCMGIHGALPIGNAPTFPSTGEPVPLHILVMPVRA